MRSGGTRARVGRMCITEPRAVVTAVTADSITTCDTTLRQPLARLPRSPIELSSRRPNRGPEAKGNLGGQALWTGVGRSRDRWIDLGEAARLGSAKTGSPEDAAAVDDEAAEPHGLGRAVQIDSASRWPWLLDGEVERASSRGSARCRFASVAQSGQREHGAPPTHTWRGPGLRSGHVYRSAASSPRTSDGVSADSRPAP